LFIFERPSIPSRFAWLYSCSRVWLPLLEPERLRDELDRDRDDELFVSPFCARCLFTVRAAISFARFVERPCFFSELLTCSYCRSRFVLQAFGIAKNPFLVDFRILAPVSSEITRG
jgi:hypothetical protein